MKNFLIFLFALSVFVVACKKKEEEKPDKTSMISKSWKNTASPGDTLILNSDGTGSNNQSATIHVSLTWYFKNDQTVIHVTAGLSESDYTIDKLDTDNLWINNGTQYQYVRIP
jgi:hypothetical protein